MSVITLRQTGQEGRLALPVINELSRRRSLVLVFALGFPLVFYLLLLAVLVVKYGHWPNYVTPYNWVSNVLRIIAGTNSVSDMVPIILDEWLLETGFINYDYGHGIADWSLTIIPHKFAVVSLAGAFIGLNVGLLLDQKTVGTWAQQSIQACRFGLLTSAGAICASITNATVFSVVHCATPSWVGSLAVLGFDSYDVFAIEPFGPVICAFGIAALVLSALLTIRDGRIATESTALQSAKEAAPC